eukprot:2149938-Pyramimonas_sp.AAC.1
MLQHPTQYVKNSNSRFNPLDKMSLQLEQQSQLHHGKPWETPVSAQANGCAHALLCIRPRCACLCRRARTWVANSLRDVAHYTRGERAGDPPGAPAIRRPDQEAAGGHPMCGPLFCFF